MTAAEIEPVDHSHEIRAAYATYLKGTLGRSPLTVGTYDRTLWKVALHLEDGDLLTATDAELRQVFVMSTWAQGLTPKTKRAKIGVVVGFYDWLAHDACLIDEPPTKGLRRLATRLDSGTQKLPTYLTMPAVEQLLEALDSEVTTVRGKQVTRPRTLATRDRAIVGVMAYAGGRATETICGLQLDDVDLGRGEITFRTLTKRRKQRSVPISPLLRPLLEAWLRVREDAPSQTLFLSRYGKPYPSSEAWADHVLHRAAMRAGLQWVECEEHGRDGCVPPKRGHPGRCPLGGWRVHPHALRHSFAVEALRSGACNIAELRDLLGHSNIATTNIYLALVKEPSSNERFRRRFGKKG